MISFTNTVTIERPIGDVFSYLSDLEHTPEWNWAISETRKMTPGPVTVGTRYHQTRAVPRPATEILEVTRLNPDRRVEIRGTLAEMPAHLIYEVEEAESGTAVTNSVSLDVEGPARLLAPILGRRISQAVASNLHDLKTRLETRHDQMERSNP